VTAIEAIERNLLMRKVDRPIPKYSGAATVKSAENCCMPRGNAFAPE